MSLRKFSFCFLSFVSFVFACRTSQAQVLYPPDLNCVNTQGNGWIQLDWTLPTNPCGPFIGYVIYGSTNQNGPYDIVDTVDNEFQTSFVDTNVNGNTTTWYYYMISLYNCAGYFSLTSDTLENLDPVAPTINYVTVSGTNATLNWNPSPSPETYGYIIYLVVNGSYLPIDTVYGALNTTYTDLVNSSGTSSQSYTIAAIDSCGQAGTINTSPHATIFVNVATQNCTALGIATWNAYQNWTNGVMSYQLYVSYNAQPFVLMDSTTAFIDSFQYTIANVCIYIVATENATGFTSASNVVCVSGNPESPVSDLYVHTATVLTQGINRIFYSVNPVSDVLNILIERSEDGINYTSIDAFPPSGSMTGIQQYDDETVLNESRSYYYRVSMKDNCNNTIVSNFVKTILLNGYAYSNYVNSLYWDSFKHQLGSVIYYTLERNSAAGWQPLTLTNPLDLIYEENAANDLGDTGTLCYVVTATALVQLGTLTDTVTSRSNELCLDQLIKIGVPNAFAPEGNNSVFKPVTRFTGNKSYVFEIYNRWGGLIFSTKNFDEGWDGSYDGKLVPMGAYAYYIEVVDNVGRRTERKGTVLVIR